MADLLDKDGLSGRMLRCGYAGEVFLMPKDVLFFGAMPKDAHIT